MIAWCLSAAWAAVTLEAPPHQGIETVIALTDDQGEVASGETVRVVHRPGLSGEKELAIGITDGRGRVRWTPELAGVARLRAGEEVQLVRVEPATVPSSIPVLLGLLGAAALGALGFGLLERRG